MKNGVSVFTSNVDGQFQRAGFDPACIHECHGSIHHLQCTEPCTSAIWSADDFEPRVDEEACLLTNPMPACSHCGKLGAAKCVDVRRLVMDTVREGKRRQADSTNGWLT